MDKSVYCRICFKKCPDVGELKTHVDERHKKLLRSDDDGEKSVKKNNGDVEHQKNKDDDEPSKSWGKNNKFESFKDYNRLERKYVECTVCQEICADESALREHCEHQLYRELSKAHQTKCGICSKIYSSALGLHKHFKSHKSYVYVCNICDKQYQTKESLSKHLKSHNPDTCVCDICDERFKTKEDLSKHVCMKYTCNVCDDVFRSKDELLKHFFVHKSLQGSDLHFTDD